MRSGPGEQTRRLLREGNAPSVPERRRSEPLPTDSWPGRRPKWGVGRRGKEDEVGEGGSATTDREVVRAADPGHKALPQRGRTDVARLEESLRWGCPSLRAYLPFFKRL